MTIKQKKHIYVLLRNKIVGTDNVLPLCMQLHNECGFTFTFMLFDYDSFKAIKDDNVVLSDAINTIGRLVFVGSNKHGVISKTAPIFFLIKMIFNINFNKNYVMHPGGMYVKPLKYILNFLPSKGIIFHETSPYGRRQPYNGTESAFEFFNLRQTQDEYEDSKIGEPAFLKAEVLIGYNKLWNFFKHPYAVNAHKIVLDNPRNTSAWIDFIQKKSFDYVSEELYRNLPYKKDKPIITIFTGRLHLDKTPGKKFVESFIQMINAISKSTKNKCAIFIKPHIFSDIEFLKKCISEGCGEHKMEYILTKLHPSVLSSRSSMAFFSNNSTVINEVSNLNIPVIQCLYGFDGDKDIEVQISKKSDYVLTKKSENLKTIIDNLITADSSPAVYKKHSNLIDCSFVRT